MKSWHWLMLVTFAKPSDNPKEMKIHVVIDMQSTTTTIGLLTKHLKADDFFDVAHSPKSEFVLGSISPSGDAGSYQATGQLTMHGVQRPVAFPARITVTPEEVSFDATITIRQTEFGIEEAVNSYKLVCNTNLFEITDLGHPSNGRSRHF